MKSLAIAGLVLAITSGSAAHAMQEAPAAEAAVAAAPVAAEAAAVRSGATLRSTDGARIGRVERVFNDANGNAERVSVIFDTRFVYIPVATISASEKGLVTSLTKAEVRKLK